MNRSPRVALRVGIATALAVPAAAWLGRASDAVWWQVLPWVLLAFFWAYLLHRHRRGTLRDTRLGQ